ncbi:unnamed protein product [Trifolium pratense]|uniref:Uncharacterized protein n=1 Tax=Trifolium pratense TaxID=57577 RepID=A0ACB0KKI6_TRIPR|nr:unnamed protein product [Trifolium pratense]
MVGPRVLQGESLEAFNEGIGYILNQCFALQTVIDYEIGDNNSHPKLEQLIADVRSWFAHSKEPHHIGELTILIKEGMNTAFDLVIRDGSAEDMAAKIMGIRAQCIVGNFENIKLLREQGKMNVLLLHSSQCDSAHCRYPNCRQMKGLFYHAKRCRTRIFGGCVICKKVWYLIQLHARACNKSECNVPRCSDVKEHRRRLQQQSNSQQRAGSSDGNDVEVANNAG